MSDTTGSAEPHTAGMAADRRAAFEAEISRIQLKAGRAANEQRFIAVGLAAMVAGIAVTLIAFLVSTTQGDTRDVISMGILATFGLTLAVAGAALFLRYALGRFFRFWLLRLIYEQRPPGD